MEQAAGSELYIGLMSGTSLDGIDTVLVDFEEKQPIQCLSTHYTELSPELRQGLLQLCSPGENEIERMGKMDRLLAQTMAEAVNTLLENAGVEPHQIRAIGSHGQTVRHYPEAQPPFTLQIGDPNTLAELTGITVVADFRRRDIAAGGTGAPMVPGFHQYAFYSPTEMRMILNIGGFANLSVLHPQDQSEVLGYDCGPGNVLLDAWINQNLQQNHDADGTWARSGKVNSKLLRHLLEHPFFKRKPPRSTGREEFNLEWLKSRINAAMRKKPAPEDVQATLLEFTAQSISQCVKSHLNGLTSHLFVCGGGALNSYLMERLQILCQECQLQNTGKLGLPPEWVEAIAFAWLARQHIIGSAGNIPSVTGARNARILGMLCPGQANTNPDSLSN